MGAFLLPKKINGGGPQGATIGILEYLSQSNNNADWVEDNDRFKFVDDLTILEIVDLLTVGLTSYNIRQHVPSDISVHNQFIPPQNLKSQQWLQDIDAWTTNQKMKLNQNKTKNMTFNFTNNYQFSTRLQLNDQNLESIESTKLLGTIISNDLIWNLNTKNVVQKANARMQILRKASSFGASIDDLKLLYYGYIRNRMEQCATVWHSNLTEESKDDVKRI